MTATAAATGVRLGSDLLLASGRLRGQTVGVVCNHASVDRGYAHVLDRVAGSPVWQRLNDGDPYRMGESVGISAEEGLARAVAAQNVCLWCDEFFKQHPETIPARLRTPG